MSDGNRCVWPENVGILAIEVYFPTSYVNQEKLEEYDRVSKGKYTVGLGQIGMGFCGDREDTNSLSLTVVQNLMEKNSIDPNQIGRLEVGTESILDKSKSVKTVLMQLFEQSGNFNIEGVDTINACFGGTQALFNSVAWVESSAWDGRLAIVVCADIAVYAAGNARPSGGAGAIAMLIGPDAPLIMERGMRFVHIAHAYDFYKPDMNSEYPVVDGKLSVNCFLGALDKCYQGYQAKVEQKRRRTDSNMNDSGRVGLEHFDYMAFHVPFSRLCQKSLARMMLNDYLQKTKSGGLQDKKYEALSDFRDINLEQLVNDPVLAKEVEKASLKCSQTAFEEKTEASLLVSRNVGNMYTPSLYAALASILVSKSFLELRGHRIGMFSYGSGLASAMFSFIVSDKETQTAQKLFKNLADIPGRLKARTEVPPDEFVKILEIREKTHHLNNYTPWQRASEITTGAYCLLHVDEKYRRSYARKTSVGFVDFDGNCVIVEKPLDETTVPACQLY